MDEKQAVDMVIDSFGHVSLLKQVQQLICVV